jgi:WG containing repeat
MIRKNLLLVLLLTLTGQLFAQDPDMSMIPYRNGDLWGYADVNKAIIIKPQFEEASLFYEGLAAVKKNGKYGYINKDGKTVIPFVYFSAKPFRFGYYDVSGNNKPGDGSINEQKTVLFAGAAPKADGYEICINAKGVKIKCPAINENSAPDLNKANTETVKKTYTGISKPELFDNIVDDYKMAGTEDTYYIATRNNNYGIFNNKYEVVVPFEYAKIEKLMIGAMNYVIVDKAGMKGILFGNGSPYMALENTRLQYVPAKDGKRYFIYAKDGKTGLKNNQYATIAEPRYDDITYDADGSGFILTTDPYKGYVFSSGVILEPRFAEVKAIKGGEYLMVKNSNGKWGYVNSRLVEFYND